MKARARPLFVAGCLQFAKASRRREGEFVRNVLAAMLWIALVGFAAENGFTSPPVPAKFKSAPAVVLKETRAWNVVPLRYADFDVSERVLIQDPRGFAEADRAILYDSKRSKLQGFSARTIQPNGTIVEVPQDLIHDFVVFKTEGVEYHSLQFTFLSVRPGSVLELEYRIHEKETNMVRKWEPQRTIPVLESSFHMSVKQPAHVVPVHIYTIGRGIGGQSCEVTETKQGSRTKKFTMICRELPALEIERQSPPERDVRIRLDALWGPERLISDQWKHFAKRWSESIGRFTRQCGGCKKLASDLTREATSDADKVDKIIEWVKRNLEFRSPPIFSGSGGPALFYAAAEKVLENRGGWPNEITLLTMALLRGAGVQANPILVADRSEGRFHYDALDSAEHLMLEALIDGARCVVDPSCRYCEPGTTDWRYAANKGYAGVRLAGAFGAPVVVGTIPAVHNANRRTERVELAEDGTAQISGAARWSGQFSVNLRERWAEMSDDARREDFLGSLVGTVDEPKVDLSDPDDVFQPLTAHYAFESGSIVLPDGRMLIRPLDVFSDRLPVPIQEQRETPLWFPFPFSVEAETVFKLPAGYRAEMPGEPITLSGPGMTFRYRWATGYDTGEVVWRGSLIVKDVEVAPEKYGEARSFARTLRHLLRGGLVATRSSSPVSKEVQ